MPRATYGRQRPWRPSGRRSRPRYGSRCRKVPAEARVARKVARRQRGGGENSMPVRELSGCQRRPESRRPNRGDRVEATIGAVFDEGLEERQLTLLGEWQQGVQSRAVDTHDQQPGPDTGGHRRGSRVHARGGMERLPPLHHDVHRRQRHQRQPDPAAPAILSMMQTVEQCRVETDQGCQREPRGGFDEPNVDAGGQVESEVGGVEPVDQAGGAQHHRECPRQDARGAVMFPPAPGSQQCGRNDTHQAPEHGDGSQNGAGRERKIRIEKEKQSRDVGSRDQAGNEAGEENQGDGDWQPVCGRSRRRSSRVSYFGESGVPGTI